MDAFLISLLIKWTTMPETFGDNLSVRDMYIVCASSGQNLQELARRKFYGSLQLNKHKTPVTYMYSKMMIYGKNPNIKSHYCIF